MSGIAKCIGDVLRHDVISTTASSYVATYPTLFNSASAVPTFVYMSLKDIMVTGTSWASYDWNKMVVDTYGRKLTGTRSIDIGVTRVLDQIDSPRDCGPKSSAFGAKYAEVSIYLKLADEVTPVDFDRLRQAALRIERLIDYNYAVNVRGIPNYIPATDTALDPNFGIKVYWEGESTVKEAIQDRDVGMMFYSFYKNLVLP